MSIKIVTTITLTVWNLIIFLLMGINKYKAQRGKRRVSEKTLFMSAFIFGGIGIWGGMYVFRHKTKHWSFKILVPVAVIINVTIYYYIYEMISNL